MRMENPTKPCRFDQIVSAGRRIINQARVVAILPASTTREEYAEAMVSLKRALDVYDRINRPFTEPIEEPKKCTNHQCRC